MYAVIKTGGKQYRVSPSDQIVIERLTAEPGDQIRLSEVLAIGDGAALTVGAPMIEGAAVDATVVEQPRGRKILVFKKRRRKNSRTLNGHRQNLTVLRIDTIHAEGAPALPAAVAEKPVKAKPAPKAQPKDQPEAAPRQPEVAAKTEAKTEAKKTEPKEAAPKKAAAAPAAEAEEGSPPELLDAPRGVADDLKKIGGVGPKLAATLNELGIYHYAQIAALTPEQVAWVDQRLKFKGRIARDNWIEQAATLAAEQEG